MAKLSRRKISSNIAARLASGESSKTVLRELAAYLIDTGRKREAPLVVRDVEAMLLDQGTAIGTVTSARPLSSASVATIESYVKQSQPGIKKVVLREEVYEQLIGGVKLELPGRQLDVSVKARLDKITA